MRILVLGGTSFVGRAVVEQALADGHELTLFSRGRTGTELFPDVERRTGDRDEGDYASLLGRQLGRRRRRQRLRPAARRQASRRPARRVGRYLFISTGSVYDPTRATSRSPRRPPAGPERGTEDITGDTYGPLKVACEDDVLDRWGQAATIVRPGVVAGPHDPTDRFTYWCAAAADGGRVALPPGRTSR
jgi:2'-hydroxyisoflavone reductase